MTDLHLPSLSIQSFRGIDDLSIPKLGRVTLLAGKNGVGKTTVLDAVRVYAARGRYQALHDLLAVRQEFTAPSHEQRNRIHGLEWSSLFHGRITTAGAHISIGLTNGAGQLAITHAELAHEQGSDLAKAVRNEDIPRHDLWTMVLQTAHANDVQVLATTHSWDCVTGFAQAAEVSEAEGILIRLERDEKGLRAVEYSENDLRVVAEQGIKVR